MRSSKIKRLFDFIVGSVGLILSLPLLILVAATILTFMGRPILFRQARPGLNGKPFVMTKFRTMRDATPDEIASGSDSARITRLGAILRKYSLDELPEFWHVVTGEMSLVGPRPLLIDYLPLYSQRHARRHEVRPGITGWAQINGRNSVDWNSKFDLDVWYVDNQSLKLDMIILVRTFWKVIGARDTESGAPETTMPRFTGDLDDHNERF